MPRLHPAVILSHLATGALSGTQHATVKRPLYAPMGNDSARPGNPRSAASSRLSAFRSGIPLHGLQRPWTDKAIEDQVCKPKTCFIRKAVRSVQSVESGDGPEKATKVVIVDCYEVWDHSPLGLTLTQSWP